ncbi:hypothetical protein ACEPAF_5505 [Sanghuangporus sanghuang]
MSLLIKKFLNLTAHSQTEAMKHNAREPKLVVAHFMVGNTAPYNPYDWEEDIRLASKHGIDGFALNVGKEDWQFDQVSACFEAAERSATNFKLFISFDMSSLGSSSLQDISLLKRYIQEFSCHSHYMHYNRKALVSTFAGENSLFGCPDCESGWMLVKDTLEEVCPIFFVPSFFIDPRRFRSMRCLDGAFNWNGCWPVHLSSDSPPEEIRHPKLLSDIEYLHNLRSSDGHRKTYMASVSPWFFTHYGEDSWNKNWIYRGDDWLLVRRWQQLIAMRDDIDIVQVISWNDYGESHYIGPIKGAQPNSESWVDGFDHTAWLHLCGYFAHAFKAEHKIPLISGTDFKTNEDCIFVWTRPHPRDAEAYADPVGRPRGWDLTEDVYWVVVLACAPAHVSLRCTGGDDDDLTSGMPIHNPDDMEVLSVNHRIPPGLSMISCPFIAGGRIRVQLLRRGEEVLNFYPRHFVFDARPKTYNFNAYVWMHPPSS